MKASLLFAAIGAATLLAGVAGPAAQADGTSRPGATVVCLDPNGATRGPICKRGSVWSQDDICRCPDATTEVTAPYCDKGEVPVGQGRAADRARSEAARDGSLVGKSFEGRRFCVRPQHTPG